MSSFADSRVRMESGLSTKVFNPLTDTIYIISTARRSDNRWETAVFELSDGGQISLYAPCRISQTSSHEEAEREHIHCEDTVATKPEEAWANRRASFLEATEGNETAAKKMPKFLRDLQVEAAQRQLSGRSIKEIIEIARQLAHPEPVAEIAKSKLHAARHEDKLHDEMQKASGPPH